MRTSADQLAGTNGHADHRAKPSTDALRACRRRARSISGSGDHLQRAHPVPLPRHRLPNDRAACCASAARVAASFCVRPGPLPGFIVAVRQDMHTAKTVRQITTTQNVSKSTASHSDARPGERQTSVPLSTRAQKATSLDRKPRLNLDPVHARWTEVGRPGSVGSSQAWEGDSRNWESQGDRRRAGASIA